MLLLDQHPDNRSIMVSVLGVPNAGKSSLVNSLLGTDLSVVTNKAQTTRNRIKCVFNIDRVEVILVDTPGLHKSNQELNKRLNQQALDSLHGVDINWVLVDLTRPVLAQIAELVKVVEGALGPSWLIFTKTDLVENSQDLPLQEVFEKAKELVPAFEKWFAISTETESNISDLVGAISDAAIPGPHHYPKGEISDKNERFFASEYIREQAFELLKDEIPYEVAVIIDEFKEDIISKKDRPPKGEELPRTAKISASILVNRPSQRAIVIGAKGEMIKKIGTRARHKIEALLGGRVHLNLHVKVAPKWFKNNFILEELGLPRTAQSARVWRSKT